MTTITKTGSAPTPTLPNITSHPTGGAAKAEGKAVPTGITRGGADGLDAGPGVAVVDAAAQAAVRDVGLSPADADALRGLVARLGATQSAGSASELGDVDFAVGDDAGFDFAASSSGLTASLSQLGATTVAVLQREDVAKQTEAVNLLHGMNLALGKLQDERPQLRNFSLQHVVSITKSNAKLDPSVTSDLESRFRGGLEQDINALVQWVLREAYLESNHMLAYFATKVKYYNEIKKQLRELASDMRAKRSEYTGEGPLNEKIPTEDIDTTYSERAAAELGIGLGSPSPAAMQAEEEQQQPEAGPDDIQDFYDDLDAAGEPSFVDISIRSLELAEGFRWKPEENEVGEQHTADAMRDYVDEYRDNFIATYEALPPAQREALEAHWREHGFAIEWEGTGRDPGSAETGPDGRSGTVTGRRLKEGEDPVAYLEERFEKFADRLCRDRDAEHPGMMADDGKAIDLHSLSFQVKLPETLKVEGERVLSASEREAFRERAAALGIDDPFGENASGLRDGTWEPGQPCETVAELDAYIKYIEEKLSTVGEDAELANVDLQQTLQKQQQTIQMMSNISKMLHDTALSIIRKIGG